MSVELQSSVFEVDESQPPESSWIALPDILGKSQNLSELVQEISTAENPFDNVPEYDLFFTELARALFRRSPRHVVIQRERGVGDNAVLIELARKSKAGEFAHLSDVQFIRLDCRFYVADESRAALQAILASVGSNEDIILCLDGIANLFQQVGPVNGRSVFLS